MTPSHRSSFLCAVLLALVIFFLSSCAASKTPSFAMSFLPAAPVVNVEITPADSTAIKPSLHSNENPKLLEKVLAVPQAPSEVDSRLQRAQERFESGKKLYQQGDAAGARREFDRALDAILSASENLPDR